MVWGVWYVYIEGSDIYADKEDSDWALTWTGWYCIVQWSIHIGGWFTK